MKKVTIISSFAKEEANGMGRYSNELIANLAAMKREDFEFASLQPSKKIKFPFIAFYELFSVGYKLLRDKSDLYHATSPEAAIAPILLGKKTIVTVYDMIYLKYPEGTKFLKRLYFRFSLFFLKRATLLLAISRFSEKEIIDELSIQKDKIKTIYLGIDSKFTALPDRKKTYTIGYLGGYSKRKNVEGLIEAFNYLNNESHPKRIKLVLALQENNVLLSLIKKNNIRDVEFLGKVKEEDIVMFYNSLDVFIYPSFYEGFGYPPIEAMACGCVVICSNRTSIPEIVKDGAILINPEKTSDIANTMRKALFDEKLANTIRKSARRVSSLYTWENTLRQTIVVYNDLLNE